VDLTLIHWPAPGKAGNLLARELRLDADDMAQIAALERGGREVDPEGLAPAWD
jgi:2,5-diketo-D-gluconate reductase B